jgi:hypothetical protein
VPRTKGAPRGIDSIGNQVTLLGARFQIRVYFGEVGGRMVCVGIDLHAFEKERDGLPEWAEELNSPRWRALPVAETVETQRKLLLDTAQASLVQPERWGLTTSKDRAAMRATVKRIESLNPPSGRGRKPLLSAEHLVEVVAPAYRGGGRKPVQAVREALEAAGVAGAGPSGEVTIDQARKAVARARHAELLPPTTKKGQS